MQERIQKILSARGICSRRKAEEYIERGLVTVNGVVAKLGQKADPESDTIEVDGEVTQERKEMLYYVMNKPKGVITSNVEKRDDDDVPSVRDILPKELQGKIYPVGRLDKETTGLLLLTNDGVVAYRLTHPKFYHEKEYQVDVADEIKDGQLQKLAEGMTISGEKTKPATVKRLDKNIFTIALTEGKNRQIRRMCQKVGSPVNRLKRIRIMTLEDSKLQEGEIRLLTTDERDTLLESINVDL
ncbi:MAG: pseudouridine synthase [bacterium]|nr:pseudouridine synthase [bacterium]